MKFAASVIVLLIVSANGIAQNPSLRIADIGWLAGCWEMRNETRGLQITEMWMKPSGDAMLGVGRTIRNGKLADHEFLRIVQDAVGIAYISRPSANKEDTVFKLIKSSETELVFENPTHDFPQRVLYKLNGDKLTARIEGTKDGKTRGVDFPYTRVKCD